MDRLLEEDWADKAPEPTWKSPPGESRLITVTGERFNTTDLEDRLQRAEESLAVLRRRLSDVEAILLLQAPSVASEPISGY